MTDRPLKTLEGKVALVTGASSGIGRAAAIELARRGAKVVASARRVSEIDAVATEIRAEGFEALAVRCDVTQESDIVRLIRETVAAYGRLDIAFNNAGTEGRFAPFVEQDQASYDLVFEPNVRGVFTAMKHEGQLMLQQGAGTIINNASMGGVIGFQNAALYIATKHAVLGLTKTAALEWFARGVRVNAICPGIIDTPFQDRIWPSAEAKNEFASATIAGRAGTPEEMARVVAFLASDDELGRRLWTLVEPARAEPGNINYDLHRSNENPDVWMLYENWKAESDLMTHFELPYMKEFVGALPEVLDGEMDLRRCAMVTTAVTKA